MSSPANTCQSTPGKQNITVSVACAAGSPSGQNVTVNFEIVSTPATVSSGSGSTGSSINLSTVAGFPASGGTLSVVSGRQTYEVSYSAIFGTTLTGLSFPIPAGATITVKPDTNDVSGTANVTISIPVSEGGAQTMSVSVTSGMGSATFTGLSLSSDNRYPVSVTFNEQSGSATLDLRSYSVYITGGICYKLSPYVSYAKTCGPIPSQYQGSYTPCTSDPTPSVVYDCSAYSMTYTSVEIMVLNADGYMACSGNNVGTSIATATCTPTVNATCTNPEPPWCGCARDPVLP